MRTINPSCKLIGLLAVTFVVAFVHNPILNLLLFAVTLILIVQSIVSSGGSLKAYIIPMVPIVILAVGMFFTGYRFTRTGSTVVNLGRMNLGSSKIWNGLIFSSRVLVYSGIGLLFALTTDRVRMIRSFQKQLRVPQVFAYGLLAAWGLLPRMALEFRRTRLAFRARGIHVLPFSPALLSTLMVKAARWSEELSIAMESRGFSGDGKRSEYQPETVRKRDIVFLLITCAGFPLMGGLIF